MKKRYVLFAAAGVLALCCAGALVIGMLMPGTSETPAARAPAMVPGSTLALAPSDTPVPTDTPAPEPTDTPVPSAPPFEEIRASHEAMTEAQWKNYRTQIEGTMVVDWQGWIDEVTGEPGRYKVVIDMDSPDEILSYAEVRFAVPDDVALGLAKDQPVTFSGQIKAAVDMLGALDVTLEHAELQQ